MQLLLDGTCASTKAAAPPRRTEKALQAQTRQVTAYLGYSSMETGLSRAPITCPCCSHTWTQQGGKGANTKGCPDLIFYRQNHFPVSAAFLIEMKGDGTRVDPVQQALADAGRTQICRSIDGTVRALLAAEEAMDAYRLLPERREQIRRYLRINDGRPG